MVPGLYTSASGMLAYQTQLDVIANNLANVNTTGFKQDEVAFTAFPNWLIHRTDDNLVTVGNKTVDQRPAIGFKGGGVQIFDKDVIPSFEQGTLNETKNPLDVAIEGNGFFTVKTPQGIRYTRDGSFALNPNKELVTSQGFQVLGNDSKAIKIEIPKDSESEPINPKNEVMLGTDGTVYLDGAKINKLQVVDFKDKSQLVKEGEGLFTALPNSQSQEVDLSTKIHQGALESSNVNSVKEMVLMIQAMRSYEASQKMITQQDQTLSKAVNDVPKLG